MGLPRILYRDILKWTRARGSSAISSRLLPPMTFQPFTEYTPPITDPVGTRNLPLTLPTTSAQHIRAAAKTIFAFNKSTTDTIHVNSQIDLGFTVLRDLYDMSDKLEREVSLSELNKDREGVEFRVGDVVMHSTGWRGIVVWWEKADGILAGGADDSVDTDAVADAENKFVVLIDGEDERYFSTTRLPFASALLDKYRLASEETPPPLLSSAGLFSTLLHADDGVVCAGSSLTLAPTNLSRIDACVMGASYSPLSPTSLQPIPYFEFYDTQENAFVPSQELAFLFPNDARPLQPLNDEDNDRGEKTVRFSNAVDEFVQDIIVLGEKHTPTDSPFDAEHPVSSLIKAAKNYQSTGRRTLMSTGVIGMFFNGFLNELTHIERNVARLNAAEIAFPLGTVVKHKIYGFRGVVQAADPFPRFDVSNWDGLTEIENLDQPFYVIIPDVDDTLAAFGEQRPWRYVIQENLTIVTDPDRTNLNLNPATASTLALTYDETENTWSCSDTSELRHGLHADTKHAAANAFFAEASDLTNSWFHSMREGTGMRGGLTLDDVYSLLKTAPTRAESKAMENLLGEIVIAHRDVDMREKVQQLHDLILGGRSLWTSESLPDAYLALHEKAALQEPDWHLLKDIKARSLFSSKQFGDALVIVDEILETDSRRISMHLLKASILVNQHKLDEALVSYDEAFERHPWSSSNFSLFQAYTKLKKEEGRPASERSNEVLNVDF